MELLDCYCSNPTGWAIFVVLINFAARLSIPVLFWHYLSNFKAASLESLRPALQPREVVLTISGTRDVYPRCLQSRALQEVQLACD